jgi:DNA-binding beta-propeller fold protein YncE
VAVRTDEPMLAGRSAPGIPPGGNAAGPHGRIRPAAAAAALVTAGLLVCTGCTGSASSPSSAVPGRPTSAAAALPSRSLASPGCTDAAVGRAVLARVRTTMAPVPAGPFGVAVTPDGRWAFVADSGGVEVLRTEGSLAPVPVRTIPLRGSPGGETITPDGRYLLVADGSGAVVISVASAERTGSGAVLGTLSAAPAGSGDATATPRLERAAALMNTAAEVAVSPDGRFAIVTLESADEAVVFNLSRALASRFSPADDVGAIPLGAAPAGLAVSPDGRWLYATSEVGVSAPSAAGPAAATTLSSAQAAACSQTSAGEAPGTLTVISLGRAETDPAASVVATVAAGFQPVRVITSADGTQVWVTARASDDLLCFSAARLASAPARALVAVVRVGEAPVGLSAVRGGSLIVVADSNRYGVPGATADLDVVSVADALAGRGTAVLGHVPSGAFPREMAAPTGGDGALLVTNNLSGQLEVVDVASLPGG